MVRDGLEHAPHLLAGARGLAGAKIAPSKIDAPIGGPRPREHDLLEHLNGRGGLVLIEECDAEQVEAVDLAGGGGLDGAQLPLGGRGASRAQRRQRFRIGRPHLRC